MNTARGSVSKRGIWYLMSHPAHCPYLVTSLYTLRRHWSGPVCVLAWRESYDFVERIAHDPHIKAEYAMVEPEYRGKNDQFLHKIQLAQTLPPDGTYLYLDADTLIYDRPNHLFDRAESTGFAATQFNDWVSDGSLIKNRVSRLCEFEPIDDSLVHEVVSYPYPSVNGGVFCCRPSSPVLPLWHEWSMAARSIFICDECVLHLMVPKFEPSGELTVVGGYNTSPRYSQPGGGLKVCHGHGDCFTRPDKSRSGCEVWLKVFNECRQLNIGGVNEWWSTVNHKFLNQFMAQVANGDF